MPKCRWSVLSVVRVHNLIICPGVYYMRCFCHAHEISCVRTFQMVITIPELIRSLTSMIIHNWWARQTWDVCTLWAIVRVIGRRIAFLSAVHSIFNSIHLLQYKMDAKKTINRTEATLFDTFAINHAISFAYWQRKW